jgi:hypothetical protein
MVHIVRGKKFYVKDEWGNKFIIFGKNFADAVERLKASHSVYKEWKIKRINKREY